MGMGKCDCIAFVPALAMLHQYYGGLLSCITAGFIQILADGGRLRVCIDRFLSFPTTAVSA